MITFLRGRIAEALPHSVTIDVNGVGYEVSIPLPCFDRLPAIGEEATLLTHLHITDQGHTLFGFLTPDERDLFRLLKGRVSKIGPKTALDILSGMSVDEFKRAVIAKDIDALAQIKGLGKKTAERIVFELKDKVGVVDAWEAASAGSSGLADAGALGDDGPIPSSTWNDALLALISLGYKSSDAQKALKSVKSDGSVAADPSPESSDLLREALLKLR